MADVKRHLLGAALGMLLALPTTTGLAAAATSHPAAASPPAIQLFSLYKELKQDPDAALSRLRTMGVSQVETFGTLGLPPADFRAMLDRAGLTAIGGHVGLNELRGDVPGIIETARILGYRYVGVAWIKPPGTPPGQGITAADIDTAIAAYQAACPALKQAGLGVMYHIHGYELARDPNRDGTLLDRLLAGLDPDCVDIEMDVFWVAKAGVDPVALLDRLGNRVRMLHLKDIRAGATVGEFIGQAPPTDFVAMGQGQVDWPVLLAAAQRVGVEWYVLEDESPDSATHLAQSLDWLARHAP